MRHEGIQRLKDIATIASLVAVPVIVAWFPKWARRLPRPRHR